MKAPLRSVSIVSEKLSDLSKSNDESMKSSAPADSKF